MLIHMLSQRLPPESVTGAPLQALQLARALQDKGDRLRLYTTLPWGVEPDPAFTAGLEVRALHYPPPRRARPLLRLGAAYLSATEIDAADIVHGHALSPMILGYALRRKHSSPPFIVKPSLGGEHGEGELHKLRSQLPRRLLQRAMDRIDAFAVLDDVIAADLDAIGIGKERIHRVPNGVDTRRFCPANEGEIAALRVAFSLPLQEPVLLFAGQLSPRKGVQELLAAWSAQVARGARGTLAICGGGPLEETVREAQTALPQQVRYLGELSDVAPAMRMADVLLLPSRWESFGNVVTEAMACGIPVASTATGIATQLLSNGEAGWRIDSVSEGALDDTLQQIIGSREQWSALGQRALALAQNYDFPHTAARYQEVYAELIND
ncbi:MAG: glycosyltransferase family 4 protein [Congregibacter sp.]